MLNNQNKNIVKNILCKHYGFPPIQSRLKMSRKNILGLAGDNKHYLFCLIENGQKYKVFAKASAKMRNEYRNLIFLEMCALAKDAFFPKPIGLLNTGKDFLLLLEYVQGYSNLSSILNKNFIQGYSRTEKIISIGEMVLNKIQDMHRNCTEISLASVGNEGKAVMEMLMSIRAFSNPNKERLILKLNSATKIVDKACKGLIHGDLGTRNILVKDRHVFFVDWEKMKKDGFLCYDSCMFISTLIMRCLQLYISEKEVQYISDCLYMYLLKSEKKFSENGQFYDDENVLQLAKYFSEIEILFEYEKQALGGGLKSFIKQRKRQIKYLMKSIMMDVDNEH